MAVGLVAAGPIAEPERTVLIPRPLPEAEATARAVEALGWRALVSPVLRIEATHAAPPPGRFDALIVTSPRAAALAPPDRPAFVVGERTATVWRERGGTVLAVAPDGARLVPHLSSGEAGALLHVCGEEIAFDFAAALPDARVTRWIVYRAVAEPLSQAARALLRSGRGTVLLTSPRTARLVARQAAGSSGIRALCISAAVEAAWRQAGGKDETRIAARPDMDALLDLLGPYGGQRSVSQPSDA